MLIRYCGPGLLGLGITALVAGFMSGMAGNVSAFSTVWTYDIYGAYINKKASDSHYVFMGRASTVVGMLVSVATAYLVDECGFDHGLRAGAVQLLHRAAVRDGDPGHAVEAGDQGGRLLGPAVRNGVFDRHVGLGAARPGCAASTSRSAPDAKPMAENLYRALWCWLVCVIVTVVVSLVTKAKTDEELNGLVYGATVIPHDGSTTVWQKPIFWAVVVGVVFFILNLMFW